MAWHAVITATELRTQGNSPETGGTAIRTQGHSSEHEDTAPRTQGHSPEPGDTAQNPGTQPSTQGHSPEPRDPAQYPGTQPRTRGHSPEPGDPAPRMMSPVLASPLSGSEGRRRTPSETRRRDVLRSLTSCHCWERGDAGVLVLTSPHATPLPWLTDHIGTTVLITRDRPLPPAPEAWDTHEFTVTALLAPLLPVLLAHTAHTLMGFAHETACPCSKTEGERGPPTEGKGPCTRCHPPPRPLGAVRDG